MIIPGPAIERERTTRFDFGSAGPSRRAPAQGGGDTPRRRENPSGRLGAGNGRRAVRPRSRWRWPKHDGADPPARISEQKHAVTGW